MSGMSRLDDLADQVRNLLAPLTSPSRLELSEPRWAVIARIEDDRSNFPKERRITQRMLSEFVETFDPAFRRVPVICSQGQGIPAHWADPLPPVGRITALERDHLNLWAEIRSFIDPVLDLPRVDVSVADGYTQQSIGFRPPSNESPGARIWHLAQLSEGEPPGIANMPRLDEMGFGLDDDQRQQLQERRAGGAATERFGLAARQVLAEWRRFGGVEEFREHAAELEYRTRSALAACGDRNLQEEIEIMDPEELRRIITEALAPAVEGLQEASRALTPAPAEEPEGDRGTAEPQPADDGRGDEPPSRSEPPSEPTTDQLRGRAVLIAQRAVALGVLGAEQAESQARAALEAGEAGLELFRQVVDGVAAQQRGQVFQEVHTARGATVTVNPRSPAWRSCTQPNLRVDPAELAILTEEVAAIRQEHGGVVDPEVLARRCGARLEQELLGR